MDSTEFAIQAIRHDERQKVGAKLREVSDPTSVMDRALGEFVRRHGLSSDSGIADFVRAAATEIESWPIPE